MSKLISIKEAVDMIKDGDVLMVGGFLGVGTPEPLIDALVDSGKKDLTLVCNDTSFVDKGVGKMIVTKQFKKAMVTHIGTNKETGRQLNAGELIVDLYPQGTLAEKIRAATFGLGGILTPTGLGTEVQEGREVVEIKGKQYILEEALHGDVSILQADLVDKAGNMVFDGSTQNFNVPMAGASKINIVYAKKLVEIGEIDPNVVKVSGVLIDYIIDGGK
ncbi:MAG: CoA transferase subunit A [Tissierellia bacterium]|nr:CoA transferase subunit A [Tissierellia bacterium]